MAICRSASANVASGYSMARQGVEPTQVIMIGKQPKCPPLRES